MATDTQIRLNRDTEQAILTYASKAHNLLLSQYSMRDNLELVDRYYMREMDQTEAHVRSRLANKLGDASKFQDITVPIIMPQVEAALGYMANVFTTGNPMFGVSADPQNEDAALQMETIVGENAVTAGWARQLMMFFRDGLKYNIHAIECDWGQKNVATVDTDISYPNSAKPKTTLWKGNILKRLDFYNAVFDPRVDIAEIHSEGEFAGYNTIMSRVRMKKFINDLYGKVPVNTMLRAFESSYGASPSDGINPFQYYIPQINPYPVMNRQNLLSFDWMAWSQGFQNGARPQIRYSNVYNVMKLYARMIPADFGMRLPEENTPQVFKMWIVNGSVVLCIERLTNAHGFIPIFFGQPLEDGLNYQTKSFAMNVADMQDVASAMWNGYMASKRRLVGDRALYDPSRVREKDINSRNPAAKIPVRPSAYGKPVNEAVYQFPFHDEQTRSFLEGSDAVVRFANLINNQNPAQQGQFIKGNKSKHEYEDVMGHGNTHNQVMALSTEAQVFVPMKECLKLNILQYQSETTLYNPAKKQQVDIKPAELRKAAVHFKISDGLVPTDKLMNADEFMVALQTFGQAPAIAAGYNVSSVFTYIMKMRGADLTPFEKSPIQVQYEQQMAAWQQAASLAAQKGSAFNTPMPQVPPELQQQQQPAADPKSAALESTQG